MKCPFCGHSEDKVVDSRESKEAESIRRRRECLKCEKRFTTYERIDEIPYMVVKKDGRREKFERQKVLAGLLRACEKRPVSIGKLEQIVNDAESFVIDSPERERKTSEIGTLIMNQLKISSLTRAQERDGIPDSPGRLDLRRWFRPAFQRYCRPYRCALRLAR